MTDVPTSQVVVHTIIFLFVVDITVPITSTHDDMNRALGDKNNIFLQFQKYYFKNKHHYIGGGWGAGQSSIARELFRYDSCAVDNKKKKYHRRRLQSFRLHSTRINNKICNFRVRDEQQLCSWRSTKHYIILYFNINKIYFTS